MSSAYPLIIPLSLNSASVSLIYTHIPLHLLWLPVSGCATVAHVPCVALKYLIFMYWRTSGLLCSQPELCGTFLQSFRNPMKPGMSWKNHDELYPYTLLAFIVTIVKMTIILTTLRFRLYLWSQLLMKIWHVVQFSASLEFICLAAAEGKHVQEFRLCVEFLCLTNMKRVFTT
jgi:hypothetical protein